MNFTKIFNHTSILSALILLFMLCACKGYNDEPDPFDQIPKEEIKRTLLIYAVNYSSLGNDFKDDSKEILNGISEVDLNKFQVLLYKTINEDECGLFRIAKLNNSDSFDYVKIKGYKRDKTSTSPERISEVISYATSLYPNSKYDLIFWGHGTSWIPNFTDHDIKRAYGGEYNGTMVKDTNWTDIDDLSSSIPDNLFETIWFDCCYMSGIEVVYQFRNKCKTMVGYPTEVWSEGMAYDKVLPFLLREDPDVPGAAKAFFSYFQDFGEPATVAVLDLSHIEDVAQICRRIIASGPNRPAHKDLLNYSRMSQYPLYDLCQFMEITSELNGSPEFQNQLRNVLNDFVIYKDASSCNFNMKPWDINNISGLSTHFYKGLQNGTDNYYRKLDWYKRVYE